MISDETKKRLAQAQRHRWMRWLGAPLLCSGVVVVFLSAISTTSGDGPIWVLMGLIGCALSLTTFGVNHDLAIALVCAVSTDTLEPDQQVQVDSLLRTLDYDSKDASWFEFDIATGTAFAWATPVFASLNQAAAVYAVWI